MKNIELNPKALKSTVGGLFHNLHKYATVLIFLLFMSIYGYMVLKINTLSNPVIDEDSIAAEAKALPVPRMDEEAAKKLQSLKDNSVNVQTLFEQGRTSPFQE